MVSIIQQSEIEQLHINPIECIEWVREGFLIKENAQMPAKLSVYPQGEDFITSMPCLLPERNNKKYFGIKIVSRIEGQTPVLQSSINLFNANTGELLAVLDGDWITAMRTGAVTALAAKTLQRKDSFVYSLIGLGNIARAVATCLIAINAAHPITFRLLRYKNQAELFIERFKKYKNVSFEIVDDRKTFQTEADILISCVTVAKELLFPNDDWFKRGMTLLPVHTPGFQNCDLFFDKVFGDDTEQIKRFKYFSRFKQYDEISNVLKGNNPGRENDNERIISYNYGMGLHDIVFASKIYEKAKDKVQGVELKKQNKKIWF